jgi:toxin ParE1/3/4
MAERRWRVVLGALAERDFAAIIAWAAETFGQRQASAYRNTLVAALRALEEGPTITGAKSREKIRPGLMSLHVARGGRRGRHFIMSRGRSPVGECGGWAGDLPAAPTRSR